MAKDKSTEKETQETVVAVTPTVSQFTSQYQGDPFKAAVPAPVETPPSTPEYTQLPPDADAEPYTPPVKVHRVADVAPLLIKNYNHNWWKSIAAKAKAECVGEFATLEECKTLFKSWGAELKL